MGLCKCPKRKTTSHFCFHHCVNVCEHCIVNNHATCVVKSYTTWLKEASGSVSSSASSASALCAVCQKQFVLSAKDIENVLSNLNDSSSNTKAAIRLLCYHVVHAHCLSVYVKRQLKEGNITKCPSCARPLWLQQQEHLQDSTNNLDIDSNELSPVALQLYKHLLNHGNWWGQVLLSNGNVTDIEKHLLEDKDDYAEIADEEEPQQLFEEQSTLETKLLVNTVSNSISPLTIDQTNQSSNSNNHNYNFNNSEVIHTTSNVTTINHRNNTNQANQPIHHRHFNNNYGIDSGFAQQQQQQQQQQCLSVNMTTISQGSDLSNRHIITSATPLLSSNDSNTNLDEEQQDPSGKYRPKKFNNQLWFLNIRRPLQCIYGTNNRAEDHGTTRIATIIIIILCLLVIIILLVAITSYTRSNNEPFDNNSIDYGGGDNQDNNGGGVAHLKNYNINNL